MVRITESYGITDFAHTKEQLLYWASGFSSCSFLDNNQYQQKAHRFECLLAAGVASSFSASSGTALADLQTFINANPGQWFFGHLCYDLKNEIEALISKQPDRLGFADLYFFIPQYVIHLAASEMKIESFTNDHAQVFTEITTISAPRNILKQEGDLRPVIGRSDYLKIIRELQGHMLRGDCYEVNFCQEFSSPQKLLDPVATFQHLTAISPNPFAVFYKNKCSYLLCASPERYLAKSGNQLWSQPIKGTASRKTDAVEDANQVVRLRQSEKDRSENVMVVDLVRNDLSRICEEGTVQVEELFGIYSYPQLHQMTSTVTGIVRPVTDFATIIRATFPMGSMTGAPKKKVMELIETFEQSRRGLFSGSVGYISPEGNFDLNVVIRSLLYNAESSYLSYQVGSGITIYSDAEQEYEECLLKAEAIRKVLAGDGLE